ncbi:MAG TPA: hypothetical protein VK949_09090 [Methylotenera sp.]|nr:hypothetical protein [Methylotenera sp.]
MSKVKLTATIIDDAYNPPKAADLLGYAESITSLLLENNLVKDWFEKELQIDGDINTQGYLDNFFSDQSLVDKFWLIRHRSPIGDSFCTKAFGELEQYYIGQLAPVSRIYAKLSELGYEIQSFGNLPQEDADKDYIRGCNIIVIDRYLGDPTKGEEVIKPTYEYLKKIFEDCWHLSPPPTPFFLLISTVKIKSIEEIHEFRKEIRAHDLMFKFAPKNAPSPNAPEDEIELFHHNSELPIKYVSFLYRYRKSLHTSYVHVDDLLAKLEIPDLAILDVGQLQSDNEMLSSYLNWLTSEYIFVSLNKDLAIYNESKNLPEIFTTNLTGHIGPSNGINEIFSSISMYNPAEQAHQTITKRFPDKLFFGDVISLKSIESDDSFTCHLVISQTCDLVHCNISNNHVLFIDGIATKVENNSKPLMFWETAKQVNKKADDGMLVKLANKLFKLEWKIKDLRSIPQSDFAAFNDKNYLGRLNELFALQIQRAALDHIGRVGLPIKPSHTIVFTKCEITAYENNNIKTQNSAQSVCWLILRAVKQDTKEKVFGQVSQQLINWLLENLNATKVTLDAKSKLLIKVDKAIQSLENHKNADQWKVDCNINDKIQTPDQSPLTVRLISGTTTTPFSDLMIVSAEGFKEPPMDGGNRIVLKFSEAFNDGLKPDWD